MVVHVVPVASEADIALGFDIADFDQDAIVIFTPVRGI